MAGGASSMFQTTRTMVRTASISKVRILSTSSDAAKRSIDELKKVTEQIKEKAVAHANYAAKSEENVAEKAKKSAQEAWNATKNVAENVQNKVTGKTEASVEHVKDHIDVAKRSMNTKNIK